MADPISVEAGLRDALEEMLTAFAEPGAGEIDRRLAIKTARAALSNTSDTVRVPRTITPEMVEAYNQRVCDYGMTQSMSPERAWEVLVSASTVPDVGEWK